MLALWQRWFGRPHVGTGSAPPDTDALIAAIRAAEISYCGPPKLENLAELVATLRATSVVGDYLEAGVALGGSAVLLARLKPPGTRLGLYDVFGLIPPPGPRDGEDAHRRYAEISSGASRGIGTGQYYGYRDDLQREVLRNLARFGLDPVRDRVDLVPGLFAETLHPSAPVALAHIDCDWYDSVTTCIERIAPWLVPGGVMVFDDYASYSGCRQAVDEWLAREPRVAVLFQRRSLAVRRNASPGEGR